LQIKKLHYLPQKQTLLIILFDIDERIRYGIILWIILILLLFTKNVLLII
jgi:hypothetical protein